MQFAGAVSRHCLQVGGRTTPLEDAIPIVMTSRPQQCAGLKRGRVEICKTPLDAGTIVLKHVIEALFAPDGPLDLVRDTCLWRHALYFCEEAPNVRRWIRKTLNRLPHKINCHGGLQQ